MTILLPGTLTDAYRMLSDDPDVTPVAGGTDLFAHWPENRVKQSTTYLDLSGLAELRSMRWTKSELVLGALTTYWDVVTDARVAAEFPNLVTAARQVGAVQIQARGTWAGNIVNASPAADGVPVLLAYDATVRLGSRDGVEDIPLDEFYLDYKKMRRRPDQLVTEIRIPRRTYQRAWFEKVGPRKSQAITKVGVAVTVAGETWRIAANSVAPTVCRCPALERYCAAVAGAKGQPLTSPSDLLPAIRSDVSPIDDIRSTAEYREQVLARILFHALNDAGV